MASCSSRNAFCDLASEASFRATVISTILPEEMFGGRRIEGNSIYQNMLALVDPESDLLRRYKVNLLTRRLSGVRRTATPASTLPTVNEISILKDVLVLLNWQCKALYATKKKAT